MDRGALIVGLNAASAGITICETCADSIEHRVVFADRLADDEWPGLFERLPDVLATRNFAQPGVIGVVFQDDNISREERPMRATEIQQHAVAPRHGEDTHFSDDRRTGHTSRRGCLHPLETMIARDGDGLRR